MLNHRMNRSKATEAQVTNLEKTLTATERSADAAKESATFAVRSFYSLYRPWVLITDFSIVRQEDGRSFDVQFKAYNAGQLPAIWRGGDDVTYVRKDLPESADFAATEERSLVLAPNSSPEKGAITLAFPIRLSPDEWKKVKESDASIFFLGFVMYEGPFKDPKGNPILFKTGYGARHQGPLTYDREPIKVEPSPNEPLGNRMTLYMPPSPTPMTVILHPRFNYLL
jgi:hypothetical protein